MGRKSKCELFCEKKNKVEESPLCSLREACDLLKVCPDTLRKMLKTGEIRHRKFSGTLRINRADLVDFWNKR